VTTEPIETLHEIVEFERFAIEATKHLGPFGPEIDRVCYHLHEDLMDDDRHQDQDEVFRALVNAGVRIEREALADYPWEIWEHRWPTEEWLEHDVPRIFDVMNRFNHGLYSISYEPKGSASDLYAAAFRAAWDNADPTTRPANCEEEDISEKAASVVFHVKLCNAVYAAVQAGKLSVSDAVSRMDLMQDDIRLRWPDKPAEAAALMAMVNPFVPTPIPKFGPEHQELLDWALWSVVTDPLGKAN
jgi:hypothetical protein